MDDGFVSKPLERRDVDLAFPVMHAVNPALTLARWRAFAGAFLNQKDRPGRAGGAPVRRRGIVAARTPHGTIHGLFTYATAESLEHGRILAVENLVALDLFGQPDVAESLAGAMEDLAWALDCRAIHTSLPDERPPPFPLPPARRGTLQRCLRGEGHSVEAVRLCKRLDGHYDTMPHP